MIGEALTTKLTRERLAAIKKFIPVRDSVREKLQRRQQAQTDFSDDTQQLFSTVTTATSEVKTAIKQQGETQEGILTKIAERSKQTKKYLKTLPTDMITASRQQQLKDQMLEQIQQCQPQPIASTSDTQESYVEIADENLLDFQEPQDATAREPEEELQEEEQDIIWKGNVPPKILTKTTIDEIRGYQEEE